MKSGHFASVAAVAFVASVIDAASLPRFGPASCVSVSRSSAGTCVVHTQCAGQDLSNLDISFDCVAKSGRETHSLGIGSFDQEEEYDTDLKCDDCSPPPTNKSVASKPLTKRAKAATAAKSSTGVSFAAVSRGVQKKQGITKASRPQAEWFGPDECVGVWRDEDSGNCIMETDCDEETQLSVYEFGLLCVDSNDEMNRHIFGMGSFGHKENFNTQIKCDECLALDEYQDGNKGVEKLTKLVTSMKTQLQTVSMDVQKLNQQVFSAGPAPAPAPAPPPPAKKKFLLSKDSNVVVQSSPPQQTEQAQQAEEEETSVEVVQEEGPAVPQQAQQNTPSGAKEESHEWVFTGSETPRAAGSTPVNAVQHVKMKASKLAQMGSAVKSKVITPPVQDMSMQDVLAAALKNAASNGVKLPAGSQKALAQMSGMQQQEVKQVAQQGQQQSQEVVVEHKQKQKRKQQEDVIYDLDDDEDRGSAFEEDDDGED